MTEKPFLSVSEAAKFLGVSADYIYREANKPGFPAYRPVPRGKIFKESKTYAHHLVECKNSTAISITAVLS